MAVGKRLATDQPLTEHDVAERLDKALFRALRILMEAREMGIMPDVKTSRYHTNVMGLLIEELKLWENPVTTEQTGTMQQRTVANLEGTVWALRESGMPLDGVIEIVQRASNSWDPSEEPAFTLVDPGTQRRNEPVIMRRLDDLRQAIGQGDLHGIKFAYDQVLSAITKMFTPR